MAAIFQSIYVVPQLRCCWNLFASCDEISALNTFVSSEKRYNELWMVSRRSFMNNTGPKTEPWGTPLFILTPLV